MIELAAIRRKAKYAGEVGLFGTDQESDDQIKQLGADMVWAEITTPRNLKQLRFFFALCSKLADGGVFDSKDEAKDALLVRVKHRDLRVDMDGRVFPVPRSISGLRADLLGRIIDRVVWVICSELLPHVKEADLRAEIEEMVT